MGPDLMDIMRKQAQRFNARVATKLALKVDLSARPFIIHFDGEEITSFKAFRKMLYSKSVGDEVVVEYERDGSSYSTSVTLQ